MKRAEKLIRCMTDEEKSNPELMLTHPTAPQRQRRLSTEARVLMGETTVRPSFPDTCMVARS